MTSERIFLFVGGIALGIALVSFAFASTKKQTLVVPVDSPFVYLFNQSGTLEEAGSMEESTSPYWWLNSGGEMLIDSNTGSTMLGDASSTNPWRLDYVSENPTDTDNGLHPQNIFRLVTRSQWENVQEEAKFLIVKDNFSSSNNRNTSNGLLLMSRYAIGGDTLYYAGIRVDGTAVIKKKYHGTYYTMAQKVVFPGTYTGWQDYKNLIPHNEWISLRSETVTNADSGVTVRLYMQTPGETTWTTLLEATDSGQYASTSPILGPGYAGIRTDFMDVQFASYQLKDL